jgi:hypothetical protein
LEQRLKINGLAIHWQARQEIPQMWFERGNIVKLSAGKARPYQLPRSTPSIAVCGEYPMSNERLEGFCPSLADAEVLKLVG